MKRLYKKSGLALFCAACSMNLIFAQNIELPEVTTVISSETEKADAEALPDFSDVLTKPGIAASGSGNVDPVLPEVETSEKGRNGKSGAAHNLCYFPHLSDIKAFSNEL